MKKIAGIKNNQATQDKKGKYEEVYRKKLCNYRKVQKCRADKSNLALSEI